MLSRLINGVFMFSLCVRSGNVCLRVTLCVVCSTSFWGRKRTKYERVH